MKKSLKTIILLATAIFICSCGQKDQKEKYIEYICDNGEYTVYIPDDFKLTHKVGSFMAFSSEGEIATFIAINKSNSTSLDKEISKTNQDTNGFEFKLIEENSYMKLYQAQRGMLTVYNMFMLAGEDSNKYLIQINSPTMSKKNVIAMGKKILLRFKYMTATYSSPWYSISYPQNWITEEVNNQSMDVAIGKKNGDIVLSILHIPTDYSLPEINNMGNEDLRKAGARILSNKKKGYKWQIMLCNGNISLSKTSVLHF